jgi:hypothetical protein
MKYLSLIKAVLSTHRKKNMGVSFKERAWQHQVRFRETVLKVGYDRIETILRDDDAQKGLIFFDGFKVTDAAQSMYPHFKLQQACFANMLRSEHIPFNFFIPLSKNKEYARAVLNTFTGGAINSITEIRIDYLPDPAKTLFNNISFDVFIEYQHISGEYGILGIAVKYAEREYPLMKNSKEGREINLENSAYNTFTARLDLYRKEILQDLKTNRFWQLWRNQLLGESLTKKNHPDSKYQHFTSIVLFPAGNNHFQNLVPEYKSFFTPGHEWSFQGISYEDFIQAAREFADDPDFMRWLQYLEDRYIVR